MDFHIIVAQLTMCMTWGCIIHKGPVISDEEGGGRGGGLQYGRGRGGGGKSSFPIKKRGEKQQF